MNWIFHAFAATAAALTATSASAATFTTHIGAPVGSPAGGCVGTFGSSSSSSPIAISATCTSPGSMSADAAALFGQVGAGSTTVGFPGYFGSSFGLGASAAFSDNIIFTSIDPTATSALVRANLSLSGNLNATSGGGASVDLAYGLNGVGNFLYSASHNGVARNDFTLVQGSVGSGLNNGLLQTVLLNVPLNTPIIMTMSLSVGSGVSGTGTPVSATADFSNTFGVPIGIDAFVLPQGVTVNAGDWLVNNRFVDPNAAGAIPEPGTWAMLIAGFGFLGFALRRRRPKAIRGHAA